MTSQCRNLPPMRANMLTLLLRTIPATIRLSLATLITAGLAHAVGIERLQTSGQPSWAFQLTLDETAHEGVLGTAEDVDYYRFEVTGLTEAVIYSRSELDTEARLFDSGGREVASDDDGGDGHNFRIVAFLNEGEYYLRINQYSFGIGSKAGGKYELYGSESALSPEQLALDGSLLEGVIEPGGGANYYRIEVTELTQAAIYTSGGLDTVGAVLDSEGRQIVSDDDGGEGRNFRVAPLLWPGEYFVRVAPWVSSSGLSETGSYSLRAEGTLASIASLPLDGSSKQGVLEEGEGADYFTLEVNELTEVAIHTTDAFGIVVALLDAKGREIRSDDGRLTVILRAGQYYARVAQAGNFFVGVPLPDAPAPAAAPGDGGYTLHANGTRLSPPELAFGGTPAEGAIQSRDDADYFRIEVTELTEAVIYTSGGLDTEGALLDATGDPIVTDDDGGLGGNFRVAALLWPGEYFVRVTPWVKFSGQYDSGTYNLHAEGTGAAPVHMALGGSPEVAAIESGDDEDYFQISVTEPSAALIYSSGSLDTAGVLLGPDGREIAFNDDGGEQFINFRIVTILFRPGEYILRVFSSSGAPGSYTVHAEGTAAR